MGAHRDLTTLPRKRRFYPQHVPDDGHPLVRRLFEVMNDRKIGLTELAERSGYSVTGIRGWRRDRKWDPKHAVRATPSLVSLDDCLRALGYRLDVVVDQPRRGTWGRVSDDAVLARARKIEDRRRAWDAVVGSELQRAVAGVFGVSVGALLGPQRVHRISRARQAGYWLMKQRGAMNGRICEAFRRDFAAIRDGLARCERRLKTDAEYRAKVEAAAALIGDDVESMTTGENMAPAATLKKCLKCTEMFASRGATHRLCVRCYAENRGVAAGMEGIAQ